MKINTKTKKVTKGTVSAFSAQKPKSIRSSPSSVPEPDTAREALEDEIAAQRIIIAEAQSRVAALKSRQNELLLIHRLPVEVLSIILSMALPLKRYHDERTTLLLVCRTWSNIINGNPSTFWTTLSAEDPRSQRTRLLRKSGQMPVTIVIGSYYGGSRSSKGFMKYITSKSLSFRELVVREYKKRRMEDVFARCLATRAPHLRSLDLEVDGGWVLEGGDPNSQQLRMFSGIAPKLRSVRLSGVSIPWNSVILRDLLSFSLEYSDSGARGTPSLDQVLEVLQSCPALQFLTLREMNFGRSNRTAALRPLSLDQLMRINLSAPSSRSNLAILQHIQFPKTATVAVTTKDHRHDDDDDSLNTALSLLQHHLSIKSLHVVIDQPLLQFSTNGFTFSILNRGQKHAISRTTYRDVFSGFPYPARTAVTALRMGSLESQDSTAILLAVNDLLPNLSRLSVVPFHPLKSKKPWNAVLEKVVQPVEDIVRPTWLCPKLTSLHVTAGSEISLDLPAIIKLVRTRNSDRKSKGKRVIKSPITSIHITLRTGRLSLDQMDLIHELKSEVTNVYCPMPTETDEAGDRNDIQSESDNQESFLSSSSDSFYSDW